MTQKQEITEETLDKLNAWIYDTTARAVAKGLEIEPLLFVLRRKQGKRGPIKAQPECEHCKEILREWDVGVVDVRFLMGMPTGPNLVDNIMRDLVEEGGAEIAVWVRESLVMDVPIEEAFKEREMPQSSDEALAQGAKECVVAIIRWADGEVFSNHPIVKRGMPGGLQKGTAMRVEQMPETPPRSAMH